MREILKEKILHGMEVKYIMLKKCGCLRLELAGIGARGPVAVQMCPCDTLCPHKPAVAVGGRSKTGP